MKKQYKIIEVNRKTKERETVKVETSKKRALTLLKKLQGAYSFTYELEISRG